VIRALQTVAALFILASVVMLFVAEHSKVFAILLIVGVSCSLAAQYLDKKQP